MARSSRYSTPAAKPVRATLEQKLMILDYYHLSGAPQSNTVEKFKALLSISTSSFSEWLKQELELRDRYNGNRDYTRYGKRKVHFKYDKINAAMDELVNERKRQGLPLNEPILRERWVAYAKEFGVDDPKRLEGFSHGWLAQFKKRHALDRGSLSRNQPPSPPAPGTLLNAFMGKFDAAQRGGFGTPNDGPPPGERYAHDKDHSNQRPPSPPATFARDGDPIQTPKGYNHEKETGYPHGALPVETFAADLYGGRSNNDVSVPGGFARGLTNGTGASPPSTQTDLFAQLARGRPEISYGGPPEAYQPLGTGLHANPAAFAEAEFDTATAGRKRSRREKADVPHADVVGEQTPYAVDVFGYKPSAPHPQPQLPSQQLSTSTGPVRTTRLVLSDLTAGDVERMMYVYVDGFLITNAKDYPESKRAFELFKSAFINERFNAVMQGSGSQHIGDNLDRMIHQTVNRNA